MRLLRDSSPCLIAALFQALTLASWSDETLSGSISLGRDPDLTRPEVQLTPVNLTFLDGLEGVGSPAPTGQIVSSVSPDLTGGVLKVGNGSIVTNPVNLVNPGVAFTGGTLEIVSDGSSSLTSLPPYSYTGATLQLTGGSLTAPWVPGGVTSGSLTLNTPNSILNQTGGLTVGGVAGGTLQMGNGTAGGTLILNQGSSSGGGAITTGGIISVGGNTGSNSPVNPGSLDLQLTGSLGYNVIGAGTLTISGPATLTSATVAEGGNTLRLLNSLNITGPLNLAVSGPTLFIDQSSLTMTNGQYTLPSTAAAAGTFSSVIIIIRPPVVFPPIALPPVVSPPVIEPPIIEPPVQPPANRPPIASGANLKHTGWSAVQIQLSSIATDPDGDSLTVTLKNPPAFGEVSIPGNVIVYASTLDYLEGDTFTLEISDGRGGVAESTIVLTNPIANRDGSYFGFLPGRGSLRATFDRFGVGTFKLRVDGLNAGGTFFLNSNGPTEVSVPIGPSPGLQATLTFEVVPSEPPVLKVVVTGVRQTGTIECQRKTDAEFAAQYAGQYNIELAAASDSLKSPFGFAIVKVKPNGTVVATGRLPNGKPWSSGGAVDEMGDLHIGMASRKGQAVIDGNISLPLVRGTFDWFKPNDTVQLRATGGRFEPQTETGRNVFGAPSTRAFLSIGSTVLSKKTTTISYLDGFTTTAAAREATPIRIDGQNRVAQLATAPPLISLGVKPDGRFSGTYVSPKTSQFLHFTGILQSSGVRGLGVVTNGPGGYVTIDLSSPNKPDSSSGVIITTVGSSR